MGSQEFYRYAVKWESDGFVGYQLTTDISSIRRESGCRVLTVIGIDLNEELSYPFQRILRAIFHGNKKNAQLALISY